MGRRRKKKRSKAASQRFHAGMRASSRFDIFYGPGIERDIIDAIQGGTALFVEKQSKRVSVFLVEVQEQICKIVYDRQRKTVVTFLIPTEEEKERYRER